MKAKSQEDIVLRAQDNRNSNGVPPYWFSGAD